MCSHDRASVLARVGDEALAASASGGAALRVNGSRDFAEHQAIALDGADKGPAPVARRLLRWPRESDSQLRMDWSQSVRLEQADTRRGGGESKQLEQRISLKRQLYTLHLAGRFNLGVWCAMLAVDGGPLTRSGRMSEPDTVVPLFTMTHLMSVIFTGLNVNSSEIRTHQI